MEVIFKAPQKLGNRLYQKGKQIVPDSLAYNLAFKQLVRAGAIEMMPRSVFEQKIQSDKDMKALLKAKRARLQRASQSAKAAPSASVVKSRAAVANQPASQPAQPISAGAIMAPASAQKKG